MNSKRCRLGKEVSKPERASVDPCCRPSLAQKADKAEADGILQVKHQPVIVTNAQGCAGLVDGAADLFQTDDFEIEVEIAGADPNRAKQALEVFGLV